ncbi:kanadaptin isoform X1 [Epinephelus fuscoguttatus]|uniref:kanadaptin isoform X1 n=1 Tax=Epinephelus fuscoguttatus TaxID=293821 RepID=UPI0020D15B54|nr:kanadaptin isoform X1 [Epinephelus fuscoguttatus]
MAASPPSDVCVKITDEQMDSAMETDECSATENGGEPEKKELQKTEPETEDTFKKPALFAAPSLTSKRSNVSAPSKPAAAETKHVKENNEAEAVHTASETTSGLVTESKTTKKGQEEDKPERVQDKNVAPVKTKPEAKPRVLPTKGPPAGKFPPIPYTEPPWGGTAPDVPYALEILKNGAIVDTVPLTQKSYIVVGRLPVCDVSLEHPSISRYHAVLQYRREAGEGCSVGEDRGFYIHDLGSTHGTVVNKNKIPPKTYIRLRVGHVLKFGGSTRLFILQGPEFDEEEESELTVTELREKARKQREELEKRMMGDGSDDDDDEGEKEGDKQGESNKGQSKLSNEDSGCSWGMAEEAVPEEDENEENPFSTEFNEDQEAAYLKDPKKALQGFYDREGEELEFEYEDKSHGSWLCRIKLPVDDAMGRQLVAEVTHTGKKKEAAIQCCLEACRMLEARGLLRQEAVSRKRKKKNWEDEDYYDSDDDTFLDRTGTVERKRQERMKKAGKVEERPETYESLVAKLSEVEKELADTQKKLSGGRGDFSGSSTEDPLDAFMTAVRSEAAMDAVERRKLHVHVADLRKDAQRLRKLVELTRPAQMPSLLPSGSSEAAKPKKVLPLFGAMKGGSKFKLKTGTIGKLPPKRPNLPAELFNMKELPPSGEEEEDEEEEEEEEAERNEDNDDKECAAITETDVDTEESSAAMSQESSPSGRQRQQAAKSQEPREHKQRSVEECAEAVEQVPQRSNNKAAAPSSPAGGDKESEAEPRPRKNVKKKVMGPSRPPGQLSTQYPEDDPDYCVWVPPSGQTGDGRTHLNDKYGY